MPACRPTGASDYHTVYRHIVDDVYSPSTNPLNPRASSIADLTADLTRARWITTLSHPLSSRGGEQLWPAATA